MEYGLASSFAYVNSDIISIGMETLINFLLHILQYHIHGLALVVGQVEVRGDVPFGDDKRMTGRDGIAIVEGHTGSRLADDFHSAGRRQKDFAFHARQLVEMVVLVEFVALLLTRLLYGNFTLHWYVYCLWMAWSRKPSSVRSRRTAK